MNDTTLRPALTRSGPGPAAGPRRPSAGAAERGEPRGGREGALAGAVLHTRDHQPVQRLADGVPARLPAPLHAHVVPRPGVSLRCVSFWHLISIGQSI